MSGKVSRSLMARNTSAVRRRASVTTCETSTPSAASVSRTKRPLCSSPTRVSIATFSPRRLAATPVLAGLPPRYLAKLAWSSSRAPICSPYRSTAARPMQIRSRRLLKVFPKRDHQCLREAHRADQHAEGNRAPFLDLEADRSHAHQRRKGVVGDRDNRHLARLAALRHGDDL